MSVPEPRSMPSATHTRRGTLCLAIATTGLIRRNRHGNGEFPRCRAGPHGGTWCSSYRKVTVMSAYTHPVPRAIPEAVRHLAWFAVVCAVAFLVPYLGVSVLDLQHDVFYLVYFAVTIALVADVCPGRAGRRGRDLPASLALEPRPRRRARGLPRLQRLQHRATRPRGRTAPTSSSSCSGGASATA